MPAVGVGQRDRDRAVDLGAGQGSVHLQDGDALDRVGWQQVDPHHRRVRTELAQDLAPAPRRDAKIDGAVHAGFQGWIDDARGYAEDLAARRARR